MINKISIGDKVKCLGCGKTIELTNQVFTLDCNREYITCPMCGLKLDVQAYHLYGEKDGAEAMVRYTNYDDLIEKWNSLGFNEISRIHKVNAFNHFIKNLPIADVAEVKHGEWIYAKTYYTADECNCSLCGQLMTTASNVRMNYCPNCGAKMDGGKE